MATQDRRRGGSKGLKKDQQLRRETLQEINAEIVRQGSEPTYRNPNRDHARGDWDRSRRHADEGSSREPELDGDDGFGPR
jgi:hypothetical protein